MVTLHLVRHALSNQSSERPSWEWPLAATADVDARRLGASGVLPVAACWVSSSEPKAVATARLLTPGDVAVDDGLREARRDPAWLQVDTFHRLVLRSFAYPDVSVREGWEPLAETSARVARSARRAVREAAGRDVVLVGHGTALTMLVSALTGAAPDVAAWQTMPMPDHCALAWPDRVLSAWGAWSA